MASISGTIEQSEALKRMNAAAEKGQLSPGAVKNIEAWLTEPRYAEYAPLVAEHLAAERWQDLDDVFWTIIPFGTGGRRGKMYPIGSNAINDRTIGESAQGLADYVLSQHEGSDPPRCGIAYDTRHRSRHFAELCSTIMVAAGFKVYFLDGVRSTPELSLLVREKKCSCGIMVTASHNPPSDNAVKAYWSTGGQLLPPHDKGVIDRVMSVETIRQVDFREAKAKGAIEYCEQELDSIYIEDLKQQAFDGPRDLKILYSPMHGVGATSICPALKAIGFDDVEVFGPHSQPDGDFPNVPNHVANPENPATFDTMIEQATVDGHELILSTDPDADRLGCAARLTVAGPWRTMTGNQIGALLTEYVLAERTVAGTLTAEHYIIKTLVTTELIRRIADQYGVRTYGNLQVGFKYIGGLMDELGPEKFVLGTEESHGYLAGSYARDKDAGVAAVLLACLAAQCKAQGQTLHEKLDTLFWQYGCHFEKLSTTTMPGAEGMTRMTKLMKTLQEDPPTELGPLAVKQVRDYDRLVIRQADGSTKPLDAPRGNLLIFDLEAEGNYVAVRPSGTEPKVKFYCFAYEPAEQIANLEDTKAELAQRIEAVASALTAVAQAIE